MEKNFLHWCPEKTCSSRLGIKSQGSWLRGILNIFLDRVLRSQDPREGLQVVLSLMGAAERTSPLHLSAGQREPHACGQAQQMPRGGLHGHMTQGPHFLQPPCHNTSQVPAATTSPWEKWGLESLVKWKCVSFTQVE